jgi:YgiT-type zinc finger domain-containing protein
MAQQNEQKPDRCAVCGGDLRETTITHQARRGSEIYVFENVPATVCDACGEIWIEQKVLREIDRLIKEGEPVRKAPVFDFRLATAK